MPKGNAIHSVRAFPFSAKYSGRSEITAPRHPQFPVIFFFGYGLILAHQVNRKIRAARTVSDRVTLVFTQGVTVG
jgi:hypothetical protein